MSCGRAMAYSHTPRSAPACGTLAGNQEQKSALVTTSPGPRDVCSVAVSAGSPGGTLLLSPFLKSATTLPAMRSTASKIASRSLIDPSPLAVPIEYEAPSGARRSWYSTVATATAEISPGVPLAGWNFDDVSSGLTWL